MAAGIRKQYLLLRGQPILSRTLRAIAVSPEIEAIYLAVPASDFDYCRTHVIDRIETDKAIHLVAGGDCRQASTANALNVIPANDGIVLIHDGVRPFVAEDRIAECIRTAAVHCACSLGLPVSDTIKEVDSMGNVAGTLDRRRLWLTQTPQAFDLAVIREGHARAAEKGYAGTDDASLIEQSGGRVRMIHGSPWNIKITTPEDLRLAELILECGLFCD